MLKRVFGDVLASHGSPGPLEATVVFLPETRLVFWGTGVTFSTQLIAHVTSEVLHHLSGIGVLMSKNAPMFKIDQKSSETWALGVNSDDLTSSASD